MMKKIFLITMLILGTIACSREEKNKDQDKSEPVVLNVNSILNDNLGGNGDEGIGKENRVITNTVEWLNLIKQINYSGGSGNPIVTALNNTVIDFNNEQVLAVFDDIKTTGGYSIDIVKVEKQKDKIVVTIDRLLKGGDTTVMTQPFHIVKIPKVNKPLVFVEI